MARLDQNLVASSCAFLPKSRRAGGRLLVPPSRTGTTSIRSDTCNGPFAAIPILSLRNKSRARLTTMSCKLNLSPSDHLLPNLDANGCRMGAESMGVLDAGFDDLSICIQTFSSAAAERFSRSAPAAAPRSARPSQTFRPTPTTRG